MMMLLENQNCFPSIDKLSTSLNILIICYMHAKKTIFLMSSRLIDCKKRHTSLHDIKLEENNKSEIEYQYFDQSNDSATARND